MKRSSWEGLALVSLRDSSVDLLVATALFPNEKAAYFFRWLSTNSIPCGILAVFATEIDPEIIQLGLKVVDDFVFWPADEKELRYRVKRIIEIRKNNREEVRERLSTEFGMTELIGNDLSFVKVVERIPTVARTDAPVLITGETGTGKELCAQAIHHVSHRRNSPLIPVDCTGVPQQLFENEVFGHVQGAFTDARREQKGLVRMAAGGTLFLDEVDTLDSGSQAKLLRFLQDGTYKPLGADHFVRSDVRVIAATNRNIDALMAEGKFRPDLYYRLNVLRLDLPPLRQRPGDITLLACHFLSCLCPPSNPTAKLFSSAALRKLASYDWPGNVRELFNVVQRAFVFAETSQILPCHISIRENTSPDELSRQFGDARARTIAAFERRYLEEMIRKHKGNVTHAAREAGKERRAFGRMLKKYGIDRVSPNPIAGSPTAHPQDSQTKRN